MSEERLARIEEKVDLLVSGQAVLRGDVTELRVGMAEVRGDVSELKSDVADLKIDVGDLKSGMTELRGGVAELRSGQEQIERRLSKVEVTLDETRDHVKLIAESHGALTIQIDKGFTEVKEILIQRVEPWIMAVRDLQKRAR